MKMYSVKSPSTAILVDGGLFLKKHSSSVGVEECPEVAYMKSGLPLPADCCGADKILQIPLQRREVFHLAYHISGAEF